MRRQGLYETLAAGLILIVGIVCHQMWQYPPFSRTSGPPTGYYTVEVPAWWCQRYLEAIDTFTLAPEGDDGLAEPTLFIGPPPLKVKEGKEEDRDLLLESYKRQRGMKSVSWGEDVTIDGTARWRLNFEMDSVRAPLGPGMDPPKKGFAIFIRYPQREEPLDVRFTCKESTYDEYEATALEAAGSIKF